MCENVQNLRERIVAAIAKADQDWCSDGDLYEDMADAVIAALVTDELRDRIAAAIYATPPVWDQWPWDDLTDDARQVWREQADAVIAELLR